MSYFTSSRERVYLNMTKRLFKFPYSQFTVLNETILKFK